MTPSLIKTLCEEFGVPDGTAVVGINSIANIDSNIENVQKMEELDTVTFGLETNDNRLVKVYVSLKDADRFEVALSNELGRNSSIEEVLNKLSTDFDIVDVDWPDESDDNSEDDLTIGDLNFDEDEDEDEITDDEDEDGETSNSLEKSVWGSPAKNNSDSYIKQEGKMSYGQIFTEKLLGEKMNKEDSIARAIEFLNNCGPDSQERPGLVRSVEQYLKDMKNMSKQEQIDFAINFVKRIASSNERPGLVRSAKEVLKNLGQDELNEGKKWITTIDGKKKVFTAFDQHIAQRIADKLGGDAVKPYIGHTKGGVKKKLLGGPVESPEATNEAVVERKFKVGLLDSRFSTKWQFLIYQTILDLGIPDSILNRSTRKNEIVARIKAIAKEIIADPSRRQALTYLSKKVKEELSTLDDSEFPLKEAKQLAIDDTEENFSGAGQSGTNVFIRRFSNSLQKLIYNALLSLGLTEEFFLTSPYKSDLIKAIKGTELEFRQQPNKIYALRLFSRSLNTEDEDKEDKVKNKVKAPKDEVPEDELRESLESRMNKFLREENVSAEQLLNFLDTLLLAAVPEQKKNLLDKLKGTMVWNAIIRAISTNPKAGNLYSISRAQIQSLLTKLGTQQNAPIKEAKEVDDEDVEDIPDEDENTDENNPGDDQDPDPDTKIKVKRKKDTRVGEKTEWDISKDEDDNLVIQSSEADVIITLDDEEAEKLIKGFSAKKIIILPDVELSKTKWIFSPRGRTFFVKKAGEDASRKPLILSWDDTNQIEDTYLGDVNKKKDKEEITEEKWSGGVTTKWTPPEDFFTRSANSIANGLKRSSKDLKQAMSRLNFYINRAGDNLSSDDKSRLELTKDKLRKLYI